MMPPVTEDYKDRYKKLKKKFKFLIYENEFLADTLRSSQRNFLKISRDRTFLLDRLLQYEKPEDLTSEDSNEDTETSDEDDLPMPKKKKTELVASQPRQMVVKRKKIIQKKAQPTGPEFENSVPMRLATTGQNIMTTEEVERHLQSRQIELLPERAPPTVPTEMFQPDELLIESNLLQD